MAGPFPKGRPRDGKRANRPFPERPPRDGRPWPKPPLPQGANAPSPGGTPRDGRPWPKPPLPQGAPLAMAGPGARARHLDFEQVRRAYAGEFKVPGMWWRSDLRHLCSQDCLRALWNGGIAATSRGRHRPGRGASGATAGAGAGGASCQTGRNASDPLSQLRGRGVDTGPNVSSGLRILRLHRGARRSRRKALVSPRGLAAVSGSPRRSSAEVESLGKEIARAARPGAAIGSAGRIDGHVSAFLDL